MPSLKSLPWHPFLLATFYVVSIYQANAEHHSLSVIWLPLAFVLLLSVVAFGLFSLIARSFRTGALFCSAIWIGLLLFPLFRSLIPDFDMGFIAFIVLLATQFAVLIKIGADRRRSAGLAKAMNLISLCCLLSSAVAVSAPALSVKNIPPKNCFEGSWSAAVNPADAQSPDIYYIVLDGYARGDVLKELYGFDNHEFVDGLKERGFVVAEGASANYCQTGLSMSSALNIDYLNFPAELENSNDRKILGRLIHSSRLPALLREAGYHLKIYESGYNLTGSIAGAELLRTADTDWNEFQHELVRRLTLWLPISLRDRAMQSFGARTLMRQHRARVNSAFDQLGESRGPEAGPTFSFMHILAPHPPFLFGDKQPDPQPAYSLSDGNHLVKDLPDGREDYVKFYVSQLQWVNQRLTLSLDRLIKNRERPLIIVLISDHGPGSQLDWDNIETSNPVERLGILHAVYFSEGAPSGLYSAISPVNTARVLLNKTLLKEPLPLLEDKSYLSSWSEPYRFCPNSTRKN